MVIWCAYESPVCGQPPPFPRLLSRSGVCHFPFRTHPSCTLVKPHLQESVYFNFFFCTFLFSIFLVFFCSTPILQAPQRRGSQLVTFIPFILFFYLIYEYICNVLYEIASEITQETAEVLAYFPPQILNSTLKIVTRTKNSGN